MNGGTRQSARNQNNGSMTQTGTGPSTSDQPPTAVVKSKAYLYGGIAQRTLPRRAAASK